MPPIEHVLIEQPASVSRSAKRGIGEQALIPTAPAIFNAIRHATGIVVRRAGDAGQVARGDRGEGVGARQAPV